MIPSEFEVFFDEHFHKAVYIARKIVTYRAVAEDIVQEVFVKMLPKFPDKINDPARYLYASVRNASVDYVQERLAHIKDGAHITERPEHHLQELSDEEAEYAENLRKLFLAIEKLSPQAKEVIRLICFELYSYQEAADQLGMPLATVKTHMYRSMKSLRKNLTFLLA